MSSGTWLNKDGLFIEFGPLKASRQAGGESTTDGDTRVLTFRLEGTAFPVDEVVVLGRMSLPIGAYVESANISTSTDFAGGGTLDLGLVENNNETEFDFDGLDSALDAATLVAGSVIVGDGPVVGTILNPNEPVKVMARVSGAVFTDGEAVLEVKYRMP